MSIQSTERTFFTAAERSEINNTPCIKTEATVAKGMLSRHRSVASPSSDDHAFFLQMLEGQTIDVAIFSLTNIVGHITEEQFNKGVEYAKSTLDECYLGEAFNARLERYKSKFIEQKLGISLSISDICETLDDIKALLNHFDINNKK